MFDLQRRIRGMLAAGEKLLSIKKSICSYCAVPVNRYADPDMGLCGRCSNEIPWIENVYCTSCGRSEECGDCVRRGDSPLLLNRGAVRYDAAMKAWLALYKYRGNERLYSLFSAMLHRTYTLHRSDYTQTGPIDWITFVPVSAERLEERGFNQAEQLAKGLSALCGIPSVPLLKRNRDTAKQSYKSRAERLEDIRGAFEIEPDGLGRLFKKSCGLPINIIIIDDVYTTGSTLHNCASTIRGCSGANVYGLTWAR